MRKLRNTSFALLGSVILVLAVTSVLEKVLGTGFSERVYSSPLFVLLWGVMAVSSVIYTIRSGLFRRPASFLIHVALITILTGGLLGRLYGVSGTLKMKEGADYQAFLSSKGEVVELPFTIILESFQISNYPGTTTAMDYVSRVSIIDGESCSQYTISMNKILNYRHYRFCQMGYDSQLGSSTLSVSHNPLGIAVSCTGYLMLLLAFLSFFFDKKSGWRQSLKNPLLKPLPAVALLLCLPLGSCTSTSREAEDFGRRQVLYDGRICPLNTLSRDFCLKLCGRSSYAGQSSDAVMLGWLTDFEYWREQPMIRVKSRELRHQLGIEGARASLNDFFTSDGSYKLADAALSPDLSAVEEKLALIMMLRSGELIKYAGDAPLTDAEIRAELLYHRSDVLRVLFMLLVGMGIIAFCWQNWLLAMRKSVPRPVRKILIAMMLCVFMYLSYMMALRWYVSGHIPLSNGFETMLFLAWATMLVALFCARKHFPAAPFGLLFCGLALLVCVLGESNPQITSLVPVLSSPLLSAHVVVLMISYALLGFAALNGISGLILHLNGRNAEAVEQLAILSRIILYPAVFLLATGIFIGSVWANLSWGRLWGWDPKEVWALITMLIYAFALHSGSLKRFREPVFFNIFCIIAFFSVLITYFGVNLLFGGMHAYR